MELVRIHVSRLGRGYIAECRIPQITATGVTAEEAVENARIRAIEMIYPDDERRAGTMIVRLTDAGRESIALQSLQSAFSLRSAVNGRDSNRAARE